MIYLVGLLTVVITAAVFTDHTSFTGFWDYFLGLILPAIIIFGAGVNAGEETEKKKYLERERLKSPTLDK